MMMSSSGDHTKALIGQLIIFNQILGELRQDIREQVRPQDRSEQMRQTGQTSLEMCEDLLVILSSGEGNVFDQKHHPGVSNLR